MNDLTPVENLPIAPEPVTASTTLLQVIANAAANPSCDIDKMTKLLEMHENIAAKEAERAFDTAMSEAQSKMRNVVKDTDNSITNSKYASYYAIDKAVRDAYTKNGFSLSYDTEDTGGQSVRITCRVSHSGGHSRHYSIIMPADGVGAKGGMVMTRTHAMGSAITYGMRYLIRMIFNIAVGGTDDDGNAAGAKSGGYYRGEITQRFKGNIAAVVAAKEAAEAGTGALKMFWSQNQHMKEWEGWGELKEIAAKADAARVARSANAEDGGRLEQASRPGGRYAEGEQS